VLTAEQRATFADRGLLRLEGCVPAAKIEKFRADVRELLRSRRLVPDPAPPGFVVTPSKTAKWIEKHPFVSVWGHDSLAAIDDVLGAGTWRPPAHAGQLLFVTFPTPDARWRLPEKSWHLDYSAPGSLRGLPGLQLFLCVDRVAPRGGGTLAIAGVHRLIDALRIEEGPAWPGSSKEVRKKLGARVPWLRELSSLRAGEDREARFMAEPTLYDGVPLQVVELCGEPGDVILMHPWTLHAPAQNCGDRPRLVISERVRGRS
jgi:hypothetical protein